MEVFITTHQHKHNAIENLKLKTDNGKTQTRPIQGHNSYVFGEKEHKIVGLYGNSEKFYY